MVAWRSWTSTGSLDRVVAQLVRRPYRDPRLDAAARHPDRERAGMVVAAEELRVVAAFVHGRAAELPAPDHQGLVEQAALLQVLDEGGRRPGRPRGTASGRRFTMSSPLPVPWWSQPAVIELDEAHAPLHQPAREQAVVGEGDLAGLGAVERVDALGLLRDLHQLGHARLHAVGQLVGVDAGEDLGVPGASCRCRSFSSRRTSSESRRASRVTPGGSVRKRTGSPELRNSTPW